MSDEDTSGRNVAICVCPGEVHLVFAAKDGSAIACVLSPEQASSLGLNLGLAAMTALSLPTTDEPDAPSSVSIN